VHLSSLTLKGFKSFPDRTRLEFGPGVSVIVGPNGSGKSNVTDAVLWALGEQSPLAVRGQSMQDVIFGGGHGVQARQSAEVELVLDNGDGTVDLPFGEISILRRLDRSGEGEYRLNGARCRLVDVIEVLSDTGLGKEMHSVISQGRVEAIVTSKPRDRRMLIEEAAGLGKHRKRRRRAQLKLERTQENLDRALDIEREARSRLRPLKRQAEAAELHARLERQTLETRWELAREALRARRLELGAAEAAVQVARNARGEIEARLEDVIVRREAAEEALARRSEQREALGRRVYAARSAHERLSLRLEQARATVATVSRRRQRSELELETLSGGNADEGAGVEEQAQSSRVAALEAELAELARRRDEDLERELAELQHAGAAAARGAQETEAALAVERERRAAADAAADAARAALRAAEQEVETARRAAARVGAELAAVNQFLRSHAGAPGGAATLGDDLAVTPGYELALAAALGGRLGAALADDLPAANTLLDGAGPDGGATIVAPSVAGTAAGDRPAPHPVRGGDPLPDAERLLDLVRGEGLALAVAERLLADAWVVDDLAALPSGFGGIAVTRAGRAWFALPGTPGGASPWGEVRQVAAGGVDVVLARRNERERLIADSEAAAQSEVTARSAAEHASATVADADRVRDEADRAAREADRRRAEAHEAVRRSEWLIEERRRAPEQGPLAVRRAELEGELVAERRQAERAERERAERRRRRDRLRGQLTADTALIPLAERLAAALEGALQTVGERVTVLEQELAHDRAAGEGVSGELRACANEEAQIHGELRTQGEAVTHAEVAAQRLRDQAAEAEHELTGIAERLGLAPEPGEAALEPEQLHALTTRLERLERRREQLGPVNPLAQGEYAEALAHVEELETRRSDLETALRELRSLIRDTDRQIDETFEATFSAAAANFEALVGDVFPGGRGRLRLVREDAGPRPGLGGGAPPVADAADESEAAADAEAGLDEAGDEAHKEDLLGVEIEITPAGKSAKRLSLLSGGEKSMTALAFLFAVFLAKPCPFYILDEVEAALDDLNLDRFLALLLRHSGRAQFIVITHQKRTMEAADSLYGVSMGGDGVSKVISRRLPPSEPAPETAGDDAGAPRSGWEPAAGVA
jgi:chromosome segregation protein